MKLAEPIEPARPALQAITSHGSTAPQVFAFTAKAPPEPGGLDPLVFGPEPRVKRREIWAAA